MSYIKHNFETGDILYASDLNEMDDQIVLNEQNIDNIKSEITQITDNSVGLLPIKLTRANADKGTTVVKDGVGIKVSGTATDIDLWWLHDPIQITAGNYTLSANGEDLTGTGLYLQPIKTQSDGTIISNYGNMGAKSVTFTVTETSYIRIRLYITAGTYNKTLIPIFNSGNSPVVYTAKDVIARQNLAKYENDNASKYANFDLSTVKKIVLIGDSIVQGVGSSDYSATGDTILTKDGTAYKRNVGTKAWGAKFVSLMTNKYGCTCVNNGLPTWDINEIYTAIDDICPDNADYDYAVVMCGINSRGKSYSRITNEITWLVSALLDKNVKPFVFSVIDDNNANNVVTNPEMMQQAFRDVCNTYKVPFFPMESWFAGEIAIENLDYSDVYADSLHPNDVGHSMMYGIIREMLKV